MPAAFVADWGRGKPVIGILAEYGSLPNIDNVPSRCDNNETMGTRTATAAAILMTQFIGEVEAGFGRR